MRSHLVLWAALVGAASFLLFVTAYGVEALDDRLAGVQREIRREREAIRVLEAEWAYLNQPMRLRELVDEMSPLVPLAASQMVASIADIPAPLPEAAMVAPGGIPLPQRKPEMPHAAPPTAPDGRGEPSIILVGLGEGRER
jgi:hypothetical protein